MKVGILAGGKGTRLAEETQVRPKPLVEIGGKPILWHIMQLYAHYGHTEFAIALGYKGEMIKRYMIESAAVHGSLSVNMASGDVTALEEADAPDWDVDLIDTGDDTLTGGRIKRLIPHMGDGTFMMTWGDGLADVDLDALLAFHRSHGKLVTLTTVRPPARYGHLVFDGDMVKEFSEKPQTGEGWINGAFFVMEPGVADYIDGDDTMFEHEPMERLAADGQLMAYRHESFWQCMDTLREKHILETLWESGNAPWATGTSESSAR
jgi:glucose-1-phosphate cytidylyltransferase